MANKDLEKTVKEILQNSNTKAKKIESGWLYEVNSKGNPYEDFRDEYEKADMIDDRVAKRTLPNKVQEEKYFVVMSNKELKKSKLKEIHNMRFAEYTKNDLIVKNKEDVVAELMNKYGIKPDFPSRPQTSPQIPKIPKPEQPESEPESEPNILYGIPSPAPLYGFPGPSEPTIKYGFPSPIKPKFPKPTIKYGFPGPLIRYGIIGKRQKKK